MSGISSANTSTHLPPSPSIGSIKLPVELLYPILTSLAKGGSFRALATCARTCRLLYDLAIPYIYQDVYLNTSESFEALLTALESSDRYCSLAKEDRTTQPPTWSSAPATPGQRLIENFKRTRRITLGDLPDGLYCRRLRKALLKLFSEQGSYGIVPLFPNAKLLKIAPIEPYPAEHTDERIHTFSDPLHETPHFLDQICRPEHVCLFDIYGPAADRYTLVDYTQYTFYDYLTGCHLTEQTWKDTGTKPVLGWHGPLRRRDNLGLPADAGEVARLRYQQPMPGIFSEVRLYLDNQVDMNHVDSMDYGDGCGSDGEDPLETTVETEWAYTLRSSLYATLANYQTWRRPDEPTRPFILNVGDAECFDDHVRLRPVFSGSFKPETRKAVIRSAIAALKLFDRSDSPLCPLRLGSKAVHACRILQQTLDQSCEEIVASSAKGETCLLMALAEAQRVIDLAVLEAPGLSQKELSAAIHTVGTLLGFAVEPETCGDIRIGVDQLPCPVCIRRSWARSKSTPLSQLQVLSPSD